MNGLLEDLKKYENQYTKIWNIQQKMTAYESKRNKLAKEYTRILDEQVYGHEKLFGLVRKQQRTYETAMKDNQSIISSAVDQINDLRFTNLNGKVALSDLFQVDFANLTITAKNDAVLNGGL